MPGRAYGEDDRRDKGPDELPVWPGPVAQHSGHVVGEASVAVEPADGDQLARRDEHDAVRHGEVIQQLHHVDAALHTTHKHAIQSNQNHLRIRGKNAMEQCQNNVSLLSDGHCAVVRH